MYFNDIFKRAVVLLLVFFMVVAYLPFYSLAAGEENIDSNEAVENEEKVGEKEEVEEESKPSESETSTEEVDKTETVEEPAEPPKEESKGNSEEEKSKEKDKKLLELTTNLEKVEKELTKLRKEESKLLKSNETSEDFVELLPEDDIELEEPEEITESEYMEIKEKYSNEEENLTPLEEVQFKIKKLTFDIKGVKEEIDNLSSTDEDDLGLEFGPELMSTAVSASSTELTTATLDITWLDGNVATSEKHISQDWKNGSKDIRARINYTLKAAEDFKPGEIEIAIPRYLYDDRTGNPIGEITLGVPKFPNTRQPIAYIDKGDKITFVNVQTLPKSIAAYIEMTYKAVSPELIKDKSTGYKPNTISAEMNLSHNNDVINLKSPLSLTTDIDTEARVISAGQEKGYPYEVYPDIFPEELKPDNPDDYIYADYVYYMSHHATQPFGLKFKAMVESYGGKILGVRDSSNNKVIKGNGTSSLEFDVDIPDGFKKSGDRQNYMRVFAAFPASQFTSNIVYDLKAKGQYTIKSEDDKQTTNQSATSSVPYKPIRFVAPDSHFGIIKNGDGRKKVWNGHKYEGEYNYGLNQLSMGRDLDITYDTRVIAFNLPFTYPSWDPKENNKDDNLDNYRQRQFRTEVTDGTFTVGSKDIDYEIKSVNISNLTIYDYVKYQSSGNGYFEGATGKIEYGFIPIGQFGYRAKSRLSDFDIKNKSYEFQILGSKDGTNYIPYANVNIDSGINIEPINGATKEGDTLIFPSGIQTYKATLKSGIPGYTYNLKPTITIKANEKSKALADEKTAGSDLLLERVRTDGGMVGITDTEQTIRSKPDYAFGRIYGLVNGVNLEPKLTYENDTENARVKVDYTVRMNNQTNQTELKDLKEAIDLDIIKEEKRATWYNLLPKGFDLNLNSVKAKNGNTIIKKEVIKNYKNTNRDLLIVEVEQTPEYVMRLNSSIIGLDGYVDVPEISYSGTYSWIMMKNYAIKDGDKVDYRLTSDHVYKSENLELGSLKDLLGEDSSASEKRNKYTSIDDLVKDIDGVDNNHSYLFRKYTKSLLVDTYAFVGIEKLVDVNSEGDFTMGTSSSEDKKVYENSYYTYRISLTTDEKSEAKDLVIFDKIDSYKLTDKDEEYGSKTFKGIYQDVNLSMAKSLDIEPKIYYSTKSNVDISYEKITDDMDVSKSIWTLIKPSNPKDITAIAIDLSTKTNGEKFVLGKNQAIMAEIIVKAPSLNEVDKDSFAFNKASATFVNAFLPDPSRLMVSTQKTKVGIKPFYITVRGKYDDDDNRDGKRPENIKVQLVRNGEPVGKPVALDEAIDMYAEFEDIEYQDEDMKIYDYSFKVIDGSKDYQYSISPAKKYEDRLEFEVIAKHEPEKIDVVGKKVWQGKKISVFKRYEESYLNRPNSIRVTLYKNGEEYRTTTVLPDKDNNWDIKFENIFKYEKGEEINYTLEEKDYIKGYIPPEYSEDKRTIINNYYPFGDLKITNELIDATSNAKKAYFEFEITVETQNEDGTYSVNMDSYSYTTESGAKGKVSTGGVIRTESVNDKPGDIIIKDLPSESRITVKQVAKPGFKTDRITQKGDILAGRETEIHYINRYSTEGEAKLSAIKKVDGKKVEPFFFLFDLVNDRDSTIQTMRNDSKGEVYFESLNYSLKDINKEDSKGEFTYKIKERNDGKPGYSYDNKVYTVKVSLLDNGDGTITTTVKYLLNRNEVDKPEFTNTYKAFGNFEIVAFKEILNTTIKPDANTVEYTVYDENNQVVGTGTNDKNGRVSINKPKMFTEKDIDKTFIYKVKETEFDSTLFEENKDYLKIEVTVRDNGDGTLSLDQEYLGRFNESNVRVDEEDNNIPKLINIGKNSDLIVSKKVQGDYKDPDKEFKFKIKFTGTKEQIPTKLTIERKSSTEVGKKSMAGIVMEAMSEGLDTVLKSYIEDKLELSAETNPEQLMATGEEEGYMGNEEEGWESYTDPTDSDNTIIEVTNSYKDGLVAIFNANNKTTAQMKKNYKPKTLLTDKDLFPGNTENWGNPGLIVKGWSTDPGAKTPEYKVGAVIKDTDIYEKRSTEEKTLNQVQLYAVWGKPGFIVEFDKNGGEGSMANQEVAYDTPTKLNNNTFYYIGKRFIGWSTTANGSVEYEPGSELKKSESEITDDKLKLYAVWEDANLNLESDNGEFEFTLKDGETAILKDLPPYLDYVIEEIKDPAWGLVESQNTSGTTKSKDNDKALFVNEYGAKSTDFIMGGFKYLNGVEGSLDDFEFELIDRTVNKVYKTKANADGVFKFEPMLFSKPTTRQLVVREVPHNNPNYTIDTKEYSYVLTVEEVSGELKTKLKNSSGETDLSKIIPKFYNNSKKAKLSITKELTGDWLDTNRAFRFKAVINGKEEEEFTLKQGETKEISTVYGADYYIKELSKGYWKIIAENNRGTVDKDVVNVKFTNESTLGTDDINEPTKTIKFTKKLIGRKLEDKEFKFKVELKNGSGTVVDTFEVFNDENGDVYVVIPLITLKKSKTLTVSEIIPEDFPDRDRYIHYDEKSYTYNIEQQAISTEFNILDSAGKSVEETAIFTNKVVEGILDIDLKLLNSTERNKDKEFDVKVTYGDKTRIIKMKDRDRESIKMPAKTAYSISVEDLETGYELVSITNQSGIIMDECRIVATLGHIGFIPKTCASTQVDSSITIKYNANVKYNITATKKMVDSEGKDANQLLEQYVFNFMLVNEEGEVIGRTSNDVQGNITFDDLQFGVKDIGKTYKYIVKELEEGQYGIVFDKSLFEVELTIEDTIDGLKVNPVIKQYVGEELETVDKIEFINKYKEDLPVPVTGYKSSIVTVLILFVSMAIGLYASLRSKKLKPLKIKN